VDVRFVTPGSAAVEYQLDGQTAPVRSFNGRTLRSVGLS